MVNKDLFYALADAKLSFDMHDCLQSYVAMTCSRGSERTIFKKSFSLLNSLYLQKYFKSSSVTFFARQGKDMNFLCMQKAFNVNAVYGNMSECFADMPDGVRFILPL